MSKANKSTHVESWEMFNARVADRCGLRLNDLPRRVIHVGGGGNQYMGPILAARVGGEEFVTCVGYPHTRYFDDGTPREGAEYYDEFELVLLR